MTINMGIDQNKLSIVRLCLENAGFKDIKTKQFQEVFVFNNGKNSYELRFHRSYIDDISESKLKKEIEFRIVPTVKENPDKQIFVSEEGLQVMNRDSD